MSISVLITTWGCEKYAGACLESVAAAKSRCPLDVEVLELSDGSGVWNARNELIRRAKGDWLCFVDGDDRLEPDSLQRLAQVLSEDGEADLVTFRVVEEREWDGRVSGRRHPFPKNWQACAFRRDVLPEGGFSPYVLGEDVLFLMKCLRRAHHVVDMDSVFYRYRRHFGSAVWRKDFARFFAARTQYVPEWFAELAAFPEGRACGMNGLADAKRQIAEDLLGAAVLDLLKIDPRPWQVWYAALDRMSGYSSLLPLGCRLQLFCCLACRWRWIAYLFCVLPYRLRLKMRTWNSN